MNFKNSFKTLFALLLIVFGVMIPVAAEETVAEKIYPVQYRAHVAEIGWQDFVTAPDMAGTTGRALPIEALEFKKDPEEFVELEVEAHVQDIGWQPAVTDGIVGTTGQDKNLEAIKT